MIAGATLQVGFTYTRMVANGMTSDSVGFNGDIACGSTDVTWNVQLSTGDTIAIDVTAHVAIKATTCVSAALNFSRNDQQVAITAMFGINMGCSH